MYEIIIGCIMLFLNVYLLSKVNSDKHLYSIAFLICFTIQYISLFLVNYDIALVGMALCGVVLNLTNILKEAGKWR